MRYSRPATPAFWSPSAARSTNCGERLHQPARAGAAGTRRCVATGAGRSTMYTAVAMGDRCPARSVAKALTSWRPSGSVTGPMYGTNEPASRETKVESTPAPPSIAEMLTEGVVTYQPADPSGAPGDAAIVVT